MNIDENLVKADLTALPEPLPYTATDIWHGFLDTMPLWIGVAPFGVAYALAARTAGLDPWQTQGMSLLVYAGAAQFAGAGLFAVAANPFSIIFATLVINLRHLLMGATLAPFVRHLPWWQRAALAFPLTDESFAVSVRQVTARQAGPGRMVGAEVVLYAVWQVSTLLGLLFSGSIRDPTQFGLGLVFPLSFSVMLLPYLRSRPMVAAAAVGGLLSLVCHLLIPDKWYLLIGALGGSLTGMWLEGHE